MAPKKVQIPQYLKVKKASISYEHDRMKMGSKIILSLTIHLLVRWALTSYKVMKIVNHELCKNANIFLIDQNRKMKYI